MKNFTVEDTNLMCCFNTSSRKRLIEMCIRDRSSNMGMIIAIVAIAGIGGAAYYYFKFIDVYKRQTLTNQNT